MKIISMEVWQENLALTKPYTIAYKTTDSVENVFVELRAEDGTTGIGACNPSKQVVGETVDDSLQLLNGNLKDWIIGRDIREINQLTFELFEKFAANPGSRAAVDIALYDLFTKQLGIPLVSYLGQKIQSLPTSVTIGIMGVDETVEDAKEYISQGFNVLKVKLGQDLDIDIERLAKMREILDDSVVIRIDANQGYNRDQLVDFHNRTSGFNLELVEQPLPQDAVEDMRTLPREIRDTIAADESLVSAADAANIAYPEPASGIFNIKLMKSGGVSQALRIAEVARQARLDLMWGCNDESIVSISAALHAAFSCEHTKYIDLDGSFDLAKDIVEGGFVVENGIMSPLDAPGLGVSRLEPAN